MSKTITLKLESILDGWQPTYYAGSKGSFLASLGIDPDQQTSTSIKRAGGMISPVKYAKFSSTGITGAPMWFLTNPKNALVYSYANNGTIVSYNASLASETSVGTPTSGEGNGAAYYNNYLYFATPTDVFRYGPLDGTPALSTSFWKTGGTLNLTPLTNTTYTTFFGGSTSLTYPNHAMHYHSADNKLYFCDYKDGQGKIHFIKTSKGSVEGDTNDGSTYGALTLPFGYMPTDIESYGTDLVICAVQTNGANGQTINQGQSALFFWDTSVTQSFYRQVDIPEPLTTALFNKNGNLYIFSGYGEHGYSVYTYIGGYSLQRIAYVDEGSPPPPGAVDSYGDKLCWTGTTTFPDTGASIFSLGSKNPSIKMGLHNIARLSQGSSSSCLGSALKFWTNVSSVIPQAIVGWRDGSSYGIDAISSGSGNGVIRWSFNIGQEFQVKKLEFALSAAVASGVSITPLFYVDEVGGSYSTASNANILAINNTNFPGKRLITQYPTGVKGSHQFELQFSFENSTATRNTSIVLPIEMEIELID